MNFYIKDPPLSVLDDPGAGGQLLGGGSDRPVRALLGMALQLHPRSTTG